MHMRETTTDYSVVATLIASDRSYLFGKQTSFAWQNAKLQGLTIVVCAVVWTAYSLSPDAT